MSSRKRSVASRGIGVLPNEIVAPRKIGVCEDVEHVPMSMKKVDQTGVVLEREQRVASVERLQRDHRG
jgi:hypothetical protein